EVNDKIYTFLLQRRAETGIQKAGNVSDYKVINRSRSANVVFPKPSMNYSIAFIIGIMLPLVIILIRDFFDNKIHTHDEIQKLTSVPVLGVINHSKLSSNTSVIFKPKSILAESFRALRTSLQFYMPGDDKKVITVTSTLSGEGKTFISINLGSIMALSGRKTLIISGDLRKPRVFDDFNLSNETGLTSYLIGKQNKEDLVQFSGFENLYVVTSGPVPPHPSELLESQKMSDLLNEFKKDFDFIVIDTPPIGLVTDAIYLMNQSDAIIYAARQNYTPKNAINTLNDFVEKSKIKNVSVVLNDVELEKGKYSGYGYGSQYGYGYGYGYSYAYGADYYSDEEQEKKTFWQRLFQR
ncbi:MAG: polysaccharide biosynthesis tyrosine autokinase, partial [Bacteroidota bacterium]